MHETSVILTKASTSAGSTKKSTEIKELTSLRGIAAMLVVVFHFRKEFGHTLNVDSYTGFFGRGYLWVDFFFILSGFVMGLVHAEDFRPGFTWRNYRAFLSKRIARIYPLHIMMLFLFVPTEVAKVFLHSSANPPFSTNTAGAFISNVFLIQAWHLHPSVTWNAPSWSISAEWAAYLLFPLLVPLIMSRSRVGLMGLVAILLAGLVALTVYLGHGDLSEVMHDFGVVRCLLSFSLGLIIYRWWKQGSPKVQTMIGSDASLLGGLVAVCLAMHFQLFDPVLIVLFSWVIAAASCRSLTGESWLAWKPFHYLGVISYSIYMDHALIERAWQFVWDKWASKVLSTAGSAVVLGLILILVTVVASLTYRFVEVPARKAVPAWFRRHRFGRA